MAYRLGPYHFDPGVVLAPMAGVTDRPFRQLCRRLGADLVVGEMVSSDLTLYHTAKTRRRLDHQGEPEPIVVQIAGYDPRMLAEAARLNVDNGAQVIDINMGCPAKKVCKVDAGSALLRDEVLVGRILDAVVEAVDVPVTLKFRTGWCRAVRNGERIARIAEMAGIQALAVHGRTREDKYEGAAEYETIAAIKATVAIPVLANGDIDSPQKALAVLRQTGCDGVMVGRAAQGRPWLCGQIAHYLQHGRLLPSPTQAQIGYWLLEHLDALHDFYGEALGTRVARKHLSWVLQREEGGELAWRELARVDCPMRQRELVARFFADAAALAA
jgi:tRNA-dihydrouridine synthase B